LALHDSREEHRPVQTGGGLLPHRREDQTCAILVGNVPQREADDLLTSILILICELVILRADQHRRHFNPRDFAGVLVLAPLLPVALLNELGARAVRFRLLHRLEEQVGLLADSPQPE
jgi:hypothetical protein